MKLADGELRPGTVLEVINNKGYVKASVPGLFVKDDIETLPAVMPWIMGPSNSFSSPSVGDPIWVLFFTNNPAQLYWFRRDEYDKNNGSRNSSSSKNTSGGKNIQNQSGTEILANKRSGASWATIQFSDEDGWNIRNQNSNIMLPQNGNVLLTKNAPNQTIEINDDGISLGTKGRSAHPAPLGDKVEELFQNILQTLEKVSIVAKTNPYTSTIGTLLENELNKYKDSYQYINSDYVTLD